MKVVFHRNFEKQYTKLSAGMKHKFQERLELFFQDAFNPILNNHPLKGKYAGYRSFNISGDLRVIYRHTRKDAAIFVAIAPHSELYK